MSPKNYMLPQNYKDNSSDYYNALCYGNNIESMIFSL